MEPRDEPSRSFLRISPHAFGPLFFVAVVATVYLRAGYSIDLTDDAYYAALPWSFTLGHAPFVDEWAIHQLSALLTWPAFSAWRAFTDSNDGLILFQRHLHIAASVTAALAVRGTLARFFGRAIAWPIAALVVAYVPFHIQALSYNTIAQLAFLAGVFVLAAGAFRAQHPTRLAVATILLGISSFAYPPMLLGSLLAILLVLRASYVRGGRATCLRAAAAVGLTGTLATLVLVGGVAALGGFANFDGMKALDAALAAQGGGLPKLAALSREIAIEGLFLSALLLWLNGLLLIVVRDLSARASIAALVVLGLLPFAMRGLYVPFTEPHTTATFYLSALALVSPILATLVQRDRENEARQTLGLIIWPSLLAGAAVLWATANGLRNAPLGLLPAALISLACFASLVAGRTTRGPLRAVASAGLSVLLVCLTLTGLWQNSYRNGPVSGLTARMDAGPWMGIQTTPQRKQWIERLSSDLERSRGEAQTLFVFDYLPGAYLLSDLRPMTHALWTFPDHCCQGTPEVREVYAQRFGEPDQWPDLVLENRCHLIEDRVELRLRPADLPPDPLRERLAEANYETVVRRGCYQIHRLRRD